MGTSPCWLKPAQQCQSSIGRIQRIETNKLGASGADRSHFSPGGSRGRIPRINETGRSLRNPAPSSPPTPLKNARCSGPDAKKNSLLFPTPHHQLPLWHLSPDGAKTDRGIAFRPANPTPPASAHRSTRLVDPTGPQPSQVFDNRNGTPNSRPLVLTGNSRHNESRCCPPAPSL